MTDEISALAALDRAGEQAITTSFVFKFQEGSVREATNMTNEISALAALDRAGGLPALLTCWRIASGAGRRAIAWGTRQTQPICNQPLPNLTNRPSNNPTNRQAASWARRQGVWRRGRRPWATFTPSGRRSRWCCSSGLRCRCVFVGGGGGV